jgi:hypothetical protein
MLSVVNNAVRGRLAMCLPYHSRGEKSMAADPFLSIGPRSRVLRKNHHSDLVVAFTMWTNPEAMLDGIDSQSCPLVAHLPSWVNIVPGVRENVIPFVDGSERLIGVEGLGRVFGCADVKLENVSHLEILHESAAQADGHGNETHPQHHGTMRDRRAGQSRMA